MSRASAYGEPADPLQPRSASARKDGRFSSLSCAVAPGLALLLLLAMATQLPMRLFAH